MDKSITLSFHFSRNNPETLSFTDSFLQDLQVCLSRFKLKATLTDKKTSKAGGFNLIFLAAADLNDQEFISGIAEIADNPGTILLNLDPLKVNDRNLPLHKFRIFKFWDEIKETGELRFYRRDSAANNPLYWERITDISIELDGSGSRINEAKKGRIYIAQTDNAQSADRDNLLRDLDEMGYEVVPERLLSTDFDECSGEIRKLINGSRMIIHPIPLVYSRYFADKRISVVECQTSISEEYAAAHHELRRIIWIPSDFDITDEDNQIFVEKIQRDQDQSNNTMVLKVTLEELKKIYRKILAGEEIHENAEKLPDVYVVADTEDDKITDKISGSSRNKGITVNKNFKGITYNQHLKYLANSEFVIINYTSENEPWFMMKVNDIFKSKAVREAKPFKKLILVKGNNDLDTSAFENRFSEVHIGSGKDVDLVLTVEK
jgi:hypothetical protein